MVRVKQVARKSAGGLSGGDKQTNKKTRKRLSPIQRAEIEEFFTKFTGLGGVLKGEEQKHIAAAVGTTPGHVANAWRRHNASLGKATNEQTNEQGKATFECQDCDKKYSTKSSLQRHRKGHAGTQQGPGQGVAEKLELKAGEEEKEVDAKRIEQQKQQAISVPASLEKADIEKTEKEKAAKDFIKETIVKDKKEKKAKEKKGEKKYKKEKEKKKDGKPKESKKPKIETTEPDLDTGDSQVGLPLLDGLMALNELQSFSFDLGDKTPQEDHKVASTEVDREAKEKEAALLEEGNIGKANVEKTEKEAAGDIEESKNQAVERELGASNSIQLADLGAGGEIKKVLWPQWAWPPKGNFAESAGNWRARQPKGPRGWMSDSDGSDEEEEAEGYFNMNILKNLAEEAEQFTAPCSSQVQVASPKSRVDNEGKQVKRKRGSQGLPGSSAKRGSGAKKEGEMKEELAVATSMKDSTTSAGIFSSFSEAAAWLHGPGELAAEQREGGLLYDPARPHQISVIQRPGWTSEAAVPNRVSVIRQTGCANKEVVSFEDDEDIIFVEEIKPQPPRPASV